jgi:pyrroloquinoline quinone (PQQ) biosynthesis protein C
MMALRHTCSSQAGKKMLDPRRAALAFIKAVHAAQKVEGLWLAQHPFVHAVREGLAGREDLVSWVRQIYCTTKSYGEVLASLSPPPPVGIWLDPWRDLYQLLELGAALGISHRDMAASEPNLVAHGLQLWFRTRLTTPSLYTAAQACWALVETMSFEAGSSFAGGAARHLGLKKGQLNYFNIGMRSRQGGARYAAALLSQIPTEDWPSVRTQTLLVSRAMNELYYGVAEDVPLAKRDYPAERSARLLAII